LRLEKWKRRDAEERLCTPKASKQEKKSIDGKISEEKGGVLSSKGERTYADIIPQELWFLIKSEREKRKWGGGKALVGRQNF